ncbi:MAG: FtsX-like permease family protein, partial [Bacteroidota bacterium]
ATAIAIAASALTRPFLENYFSVQLVMDWWQSGAVVFILALLVVILLIATIYPALMMAAIPSIKILRGGKLSSGRGVTSQRTLVTAQFAISIFLIAATLLILSQLDYVLNKPLGFKKEAVVIIDMNNTDIRNKSELFKDELRQSQFIQQISSMSGEPGGFHDGTVLEFVGQEGNHALRTVFTDHYYLSLFDIPVVAGRNFSKDIQSDETAVIFNQSALDALNMTADEVIGQKVVIPYFGDEERRVIGVADDFHFSTLKDKIEPMIIAGGSFHRKFAVKLNASNLYDGLQEIESKWEQMAPNDPIQYRFLDEAWFQLYEKEHQQASVFKALSGIALFLCCIGIFGLVSFTAQQRQKEFGIRKVLGASIVQILSLISREFVLLILAGAVIGLPLSWYFIDGWLTDFSYRIGIISQWPLFISSGITVLIITLLTIGLKTYRTSIMNPSESIRYE